VGNTTRLYGNVSSFALAQGVWGHNGSSFQPAKYVYVHNGSGWVGAYSVLSVTSTTNASGSNSGASSSGSASGGGSISVSGNIGSLTYFWAYLSGDASILCSNAAAQSPTFSRPFSGVGDGTSSNITGSWRCTVTDGQTGATVAGDISIWLTWQNTTSGGGFSPFTSTFDSGSGNETVPTGSSQLVVTLYGRGGAGGNWPGDGGSAGGGGGGAYCNKTIAVSAGNWGQSLAYVVGNSSVSGTLTGTLTASNGTDGAAYNVAGSGGTASGGDTNTSGSDGGANAGGAGAGPLGGALQVTPGAAGNSIGGGGAGGVDETTTNGGTGAGGRVSFAWT